MRIALVKKAGILATGLLLMQSCTVPASGEDNSGLRLKKFAKASDFGDYIKTTRKKIKAKYESEAPGLEEEVAAEAADAPTEQFALSEASPSNPEITNNQTVGVDEGGIVKQIGDHLVMLQDGRLFTAHIGKIAGAPLTLSDRKNIYRDTASAADWYDEMLVHGNRILVTAYSYREQASEINIFRMDTNGKLTREGRYLMSSQDYYSTENYATRIVGDSLVVYTPHYLFSYSESEEFAFPKLRRADGDKAADEGQPLFGGEDVYMPLGEIDVPTLHSISICPLKARMQCKTTAFVGAASREFYVSPTDVFLWLGAPDGMPWGIEYANQRRKCVKSGGEPSEAMLYRVPISGAPPQAIGVNGFPADQFAFSSSNGRFRALLNRPKEDCFDYNEYDTPKDLSMLDIPLSSFGGSVSKADNDAYHRLPAINGGELENRFIGDWLVYGGRTGWSSYPDRISRNRPSSLYAVPLAEPDKIKKFDLLHNVIRIDRSGGDAVITGYSNDRGPSAGLSISLLSLKAPNIQLTDSIKLNGYFESESRSHAFGTIRDAGGNGLIALPVARQKWRAGRWWADNAVSQLGYIGIDPAGKLSDIGRLIPASSRSKTGYQCQVSCVDWYGNSRPIFTGGRIFALLGSELVEGRLSGGRINEMSRIDLTQRIN